MEDELVGLNIEDGEETDALSLPIDPGVQKWGLDLDLGMKRFLFKFFNGMDVDRVVQGSPWTFNNHLLIIHCLKKDEDPLQAPLVFSPFWVKIHDLHPGFFSESIAIQLGPFIGKYLEYDSKQINRGLKGYLRIRVEIDVKNPLKRRKKITLSSSKFT
ncbi:hypothetical protein Gohar_015651 [Gossypium harknessii]|uniref:DUF4283 domain-containing protein n=1 Tax=Gossypium harknessii TaxID=34285 RepID=A0A7J9G0E6_9ROSI|nr:hypothetical protein [Gossypium harknessii]